LLSLLPCIRITYRRPGIHGNESFRIFHRCDSIDLDLLGLLQRRLQFDPSQYFLRPSQLIDPHAQTPGTAGGHSKPDSLVAEILPPPCSPAPGGSRAACVLQYELQGPARLAHAEQSHGTSRAGPIDTLTSRSRSRFLARQCVGSTLPPPGDAQRPDSRVGVLLLHVCLIPLTGSHGLASSSNSKQDELALGPQATERLCQCCLKTRAPVLCIGRAEQQLHVSSTRQVDAVEEEGKSNQCRRQPATSRVCGLGGQGSPRPSPREPHPLDKYPACHIMQ
jgi:hypothetical protein